MAHNLFAFVSAVLAGSHAVQAIGDFPCKGVNGSMSCELWSTYSEAQGTISNTSVCQPGASSRRVSRSLASRRSLTDLDPAQIPSTLPSVTAVTLRRRAPATTSAITVSPPSSLLTSSRRES